MTKLGLYAKKEQIKNLPKLNRRKLTHKIEVLDYELKINGEVIGECAPCASPYGPRGRRFKINHNFSYKGLKIRREHPKPLVRTEDYVIFTGYDKTGQYPPPKNVNITFPPDAALRKRIKRLINGTRDRIIYPHWKGNIGMDYYNNTFDQCHMGVTSNVLPHFWINGSVGRKINKSIDDCSVDFFLNQRKNKSVISYNVIGQLNGTNPNKTVIVCGLYDSWWTQGTADGAMGMACVLGIAKYFIDHNIKPKYNLKFIGFSGEEEGFKGAIYYEAKHRDEHIINVVR
jgi:hypothetical protein